MSRMTCTPIASIAVLALFTLFLAGPAGARGVLSGSDEGVEIVRDATSLSDELRPRPVDDPDSTDTALIFTSFDNEDSRIFCVGFNKNGRAVGRAWAKLPGLGLRYILASDISNGVDFVGHVQCKTGRNVRASAVFLGPQLTDLPAVQGVRKRFPVVAHY